MAEIKPREEFEQKDAIRWFSPSELLSAGLRVALSATFGEYADKRELEQLFPESKHEIHPDVPLPIWVDYVADTGDGFAATHAVAHFLAQEELAVDGLDEPLPRGQILIHGGDLVYPTASSAEYKDRMVGPYKAALPDAAGERPQFFAIPGNHDWYDGLTAFIRMFCDDDTMGGWDTPQTRSYFSIKLTEHWWIWGIDIQFDGFIDNPQLKFFSKMADDLPQGAGVILATAKPGWALVPKGDDHRPSQAMHNIDYFVKKCVPASANVRLMIAGDLHHYIRYVDDDDTSYVTSGNGGAYLSLTHHMADEVNLLGRQPADDRRLSRLAAYPSQQWSRRRRIYGLATGWRNPSFATLIGFVYLVLAWMALGSISTNSQRFTESVLELSKQGFGDAFKSIGRAAFASPGDLVLFLGLTAFFMKFARTRKGFQGFLVGLCHGAVHILGLIFSLTLVSRFTLDNINPVLSWLIYVAAFFVVGTVIGSLIFGAYLALADLAGLHPNDLTASQRIEDHKGFVRMRITDDEIQCWSLGIDNVPPKQAWKKAAIKDNFSPTFELDTSKLGQGRDFNIRVVDQFTIRREPKSAT